MEWLKQECGLEGEVQHAQQFVREKLNAKLKVRHSASAKQHLEAVRTYQKLLSGLDEVEDTFRHPAVALHRLG